MLKRITHRIKMHRKRVQRMLTFTYNHTNTHSCTKKKLRIHLSMKNKKKKQIDDICIRMRSPIFTFLFPDYKNPPVAFQKNFFSRKKK